MGKEKYIGVKFKTIFLGDYKLAQAENKLVDKLIAAGHEIGTLDIKDKNGGNFSCRLENGFLIKRTGAKPYNLKSRDFVVVKRVSGDKVFAFGKIEPSSEARLHAYIYKARPDINCILHCHDFSVVFSGKKDVTIGYIKECSYGTLESARAVQAKAKKFNYLVQANHGVIALGKNVNQALNLIKKYHAKFK